MTPRCSVKRHYRIDRREVGYLRFILEAYPGVAMMRTVDPQQGLVVLHVGPGCEKEVDMIIDGLRKEVQIELVEFPGGKAS